MSALRYKDDDQELYKVGIYLRLSQEDKIKKESESNSIDSQRKVVKNYIDNKDDLVAIEEYVDDGYTGTNFDRPGFQKMLEDIKNNKINTIIVKDLSRFGRNYIEVGRFLEETFPTMKIRFISIIDKIDSFENPESSNSMLVNFKNLINDEYARDISRKVRTVFTVKQRKGEYIASNIPYGYKRDEENKYHLVIDEEAAKIVKLIFELARASKGTLEISDYLNSISVPTPLRYKKNNNKNCHYKNYTDSDIDNLKWRQTEVADILRKEVYLGHSIQNRVNKVSYKIKKYVRTDKEKYIIVENTHDSLVSKEDFDWIQRWLFTKIIRVRTNNKYALFAGFLICADCKRGLHYLESRRLRKDGTKLKYYVCGTNKANTKLCSSHIIHESTLKKIVIKSINTHIRLIKKVKNDLDTISTNKQISIKGDVLKDREKNIQATINSKMKFKQELYSDWKQEIITFEEYKNYSNDYSNEVVRLNETLTLVRKELNELDNIPTYQTNLINTFADRDFIKDLNRELLFEFIDHIVIYEDKKVEIIFRYNDIYMNLREYIKNNKEYLKSD